MINITSGTIARTLCLVLALVNQILTITGHSVLPFNDDTVTQIVSFGFTAATSVVAWWKNNSFTSAAILADEAMRSMKAEDK